ncbi:MAG: hypothetical protein U0228_29465, partial [Myxococcaceae bacterium]
MRPSLGWVMCLAVVSACQCGPMGMPDGGSGGGGTGGGVGGGTGGGGTDAGADAGSDAGVPYDEFDAWREMRGVLAKSPDAVPARAAALVAAKDARGLFELVRDDIALLPTSNTGFSDAATRVRWGARATLRGQAGTPRERAELLKLLLVQAGFPAQVVTGTPVAGSTVTALLRHGPQRRLDWQVNDGGFTQWSSVLTPQPAPWGQGFGPLDPDGGVRAEVIAAVSGLLPAPPMVPAFDAT